MVRKTTKRTTQLTKRRSVHSKASKAKLAVKKNTNKKSKKTQAKSLKILKEKKVPSQKIKFVIERFIQGKTEIPTHETFEVTAKRGDTILDCLDKIREDKDPSLSYRRNCRNTICGSCAMHINGRAHLACKEHALEMIKGKDKITVGPMRNVPVVKDMVTDMDLFWEHLHAIKPWLDTGNKEIPKKEFLMSPKDHKELKKPSDCIMCGACYSASSGVEGEKKFLGPATLARAYRFIADPRDEKTKERIAQVDTKHGVWDCTHCFYCNEVCPVGVDPMDHILKIRKKAIELGSTKTTGARHHLSFVNIIKRSGILDENKLPIDTVGGYFNIVGMLKITPMGLRMLKHGKMPPFFHHTLPEVKEVREIYKRVKEEKSKISEQQKKHKKKE